MLSFRHKASFLFDLDGTLIDSSPTHARAFAETLAPGYPEVARTFCYDDVRGMSTPEAFRHLGFTDNGLIARLTGEKQRIYRELLDAGEVKPFPGAAALLDALHARSKRLVLVTSAGRGTAQAALKLARLAAYFEGIVTAEDAPAAKPDPALFLCALARFHLDRDSAIVVEDSEAGRLSAERAGIDVVLVHGKPRQGTLAFPSLAALHSAIRNALEQDA